MRVSEIHTVAQVVRSGFVFSIWLAVASRRQPLPCEKRETLEIRVVRCDACALDVSAEQSDVPGPTGTASFKLILLTPSALQGGSLCVDFNRGGAK